MSSVPWTGEAIHWEQRGEQPWTKKAEESETHLGTIRVEDAEDGLAAADRSGPRILHTDTVEGDDRVGSNHRDQHPGRNRNHSVGKLLWGIPEVDRGEEEGHHCSFRASSCRTGEDRKKRHCRKNRVAEGGLRHIP